MRQDFVFADQRCGGDLRHHEPGIQAGTRSQKWRQTFTQGWVYQSLQPALGDAGQPAEGNAEEIQSEGQRLAVKIPAGYDVCFRAGGTALRWADEGVRPYVDRGSCMRCGRFRLTSLSFTCSVRTTMATLTAGATSES